MALAQGLINYWKCDDDLTDSDDEFEIPLKVVLVAKASTFKNPSPRRGGRPMIHYNYDTGIKFIEDESHRAVVKEVSLGSEAFQAEVLKNDVVQFAVALNNVDPNSNIHFELAKKLALQLEGMGMRTSYREIFDMFHSNTTAGWPIAFVFRRPTSKEIKIQQRGVSSWSSSSHVDHSVKFLRALIVSSRESNSALPIVRRDIEKNMALPKHAHADLHDSESFRTCVAPQSPPSSNGAAVAQKLRTLLSEAVGIAFIQYTKAVIGVGGVYGSGFILARLKGGRWSATSYFKVSGLGAASVSLDSADHILVVRTERGLDQFRRGGHFVIGKKNPSSVWAVDVDHPDAFEAPIVDAYSRNMGLSIGSGFEGVKITTDLKANTCFFRSESHSVEQILSGNIEPPLCTEELYATLRCLEFPYVMHAHPIPPEYIRWYGHSDWLLETSCDPAILKEGVLMPFNQGDSSPMTLRKFFDTLDLNPLITLDDVKELELFIFKFKRFLSDGVPLDQLYRDDSGGGGGALAAKPKKRILRLVSFVGCQDLDDCLCFFDDESRSKKKRRKRKKWNDPPVEAVALRDVIRISQYGSYGFVCDPEDESEQYRKIFVQRRHGDDIVFLAKNIKVAELLLCGLKVLLENGSEKVHVM
uniref:Ysc84 actin-binding domain-containing protein n=1 Tax=Corethron hystrix TaxID=216773 RepID=A0A7S1B3Q4_9STRA